MNAIRKLNAYLGVLMAVGVKYAEPAKNRWRRQDEHPVFSAVNATLRRFQDLQLKP